MLGAFQLSAFLLALSECCPASIAGSCQSTSSTLIDEFRSLRLSLSWRRAPAVIFLVPLSQVLFTSTSDLNWFFLEQHHGLPSPHTSIDHTSSPSYHHVHNLVTFDIGFSRFQLSVSLGPPQLLLSHVDSPSSGIVLATFLHLLAAGHSSILISSLSPVSSFYKIFVESSLHVRTSLKMTT